MSLLLKLRLKALCLLAVGFASALDLTYGQVSPLLHLQSIEVSPGAPVQFTFTDSGTGSTNYTVEFSPAIGPGSLWAVLSNAVITDLGGGSRRANVGTPASQHGFYRVRGNGGSIGSVIASFTSSAFQVVEGGTVASTIVFSAPFFGTIRYTVSGSAVVAGLSGQVSVNGTTVTIPITLNDDFNVGTLTHLTLTLEAGTNSGYRIGASGQSTITIEENDAEWEGRFITDNAGLGFVMNIRQSGSTLQAGLKSGGFGFFPDSEVPAALAFTSNTFLATVTGISLPGNSTVLGAPLDLSLHLSAANGQTNELVSRTFVQGVGTLITTVQGRPHLNTTNQGGFFLMKAPVQLSTNEVGLVNLP